MMESVEGDIEKLLAGEVVTIDPEDLACKPKKSGAPNVDEYVPITKQSVCYIVMAIVFDEQGRVVLIQEAKRSCCGQWYIPAGRVEPGENFIDGVKREVLEESGLEIEVISVSSIETSGTLNWYRIGYVGRVTGMCLPYLLDVLLDAVKREVLEEAGLGFEPNTLFSVEMFGNVDFYRMIYVGNVTGGKLKSLEEQDAESLQAKWYTVDEILTGNIELRHKDFFKSLRKAQKYMSKPEIARHPPYHIGIQAHKYLVFRPVLVKQTSQGNIEVLCNRTHGKTRLPCCQLHPRDFNLTKSLKHMFRDVFMLPQEDLPVTGLLTVEHCGIPAREHDGICQTAVFILPDILHDKFEKVTNQEYTWTY